MNLKPIATCAVVSLIGLPALAQTTPSTALPTAPLSQAPATPRMGTPDLPPTDPSTTTVPKPDGAGTGLPRASLPPSNLPPSSLPQSNLPQSNLPREDMPSLDLPRDASPRLESASVDTAARVAEAAPTPADLTPGARVLDPSGAELGQVVSVTKPKPKQHLQAFCILQQQGVTVALPVSSLVLADGALTAKETRAEVWGEQ